MWRALAFTTLCALSAGCTVIVYQHDDFPYRLRSGCDSVDNCDRLVTEAKARVARCGAGSSDTVPCPHANADLAVASDLARTKRAEEADKVRQRAAKEQSDERRQRDEHDVAQQQAETQTRQNRDDAAARAREDDARRRQQAAQMQQQRATDKQGQQNALNQNVQDAVKRAQQAEAERKAHEVNDAQHQQQREHEQKTSP